MLGCRACAALGQHRSTQRKTPRVREDEERLRADIVELAQQDGRYGCRKTLRLLRRAVPGGNRFIESFNSGLRDGLLDDEILDTLKEAKIGVGSRRRHQRGTTARSAIVHRR